MAVLTTQQRADLSADIQRILSAKREVIPSVKAALDAAIAAADDWAEANTGSFNGALPQPYRGAASTEQKLFLLESVLRKRREG
jgi:hypothetical protein